jgi:DNA-binding NtrC family response regulator
VREEAVRLTVVHPSGPAVSYRLSGDRVRIGRDPENEIRLSDAETSRLHAELVREDGSWTLRDCGSRNGTRVNGRTMTASRRLAKGDEIGICRTTIVFDADADDAAARHATRVLDAADASQPPALVGRAPAFVAAVDAARRVADAALGVLVLGENGTGKELIARLLHTSSRRAAGPFVVVNCPALPGALLEAELFGVASGVATGVEARTGLFETAAGGTLFLDEIGDMEPSAQAKILRVLETKTVERIGGRAPVGLDVRVVAATNHDLPADVQKGAFRRDLYHRLNTVVIRLPALRERREDLPLLVEHFVARSGGPRRAFSPEAMTALARHDFPGNVRELAHVVERACVFADGPVVDVADLPDDVRAGPGAATVEIRADRAAELLRRVTSGEASFWDAVATPYLRRDLGRDDVVRLLAAARAEAGGSYREAAKILRVEDEYKRLLNFVNHHGLGDAAK